MTKSCRSSSKPTLTPTKEPTALETNVPDSSQTPAITCNPYKYPSGHPNCRLLDLPAELRSTIYSTAFSNSGGETSLPLLQTCRQIHMESTMLLHQRPITFSSQSALFSWIAETQREDLERVRSIKLHLTDIDLSSLFDPRPMNGKRGGSSCWYLYSAELLRLDQALRALAGLVELTIIPPERSTSLMRGMYLSFMEVVPMRCSRLRLLTIYDQETLLGKVPGLGKVPKVVFLNGQDLRNRYVSPPPVKSEFRERAVRIKMESEW